MRYREPRRRSREQDAAFDHEDVVAIASAIDSKPETALVKLVSKTMYNTTEPNDHALMGMVGRSLWTSSDDVQTAAREIARHAVSIATCSSNDDRRRRRGAVLERIVFEAVGHRIPNTFHERQVKLTYSPRCKRGWTDPKEVVADGPTFEVYECKADGLPDLGDADQLCDIATTARHEGTDARPTMVVFTSLLALQALKPPWKLTETLYGVGIEKLVALRDIPPEDAI